MARSLKETFRCGHLRTAENNMGGRCRACKYAWERRAYIPGNKLEVRRQERLTEYRWARDSGMTFDGTARMFGVRPGSLARWLQRQGVSA